MEGCTHRYLSYAKFYLSLLQQNEKASTTNVTQVKQGSEPEEFWKLWNVEIESTEKYKKNPDYDSWFIDIEDAEQKLVLEKPLVYSMDKKKMMQGGEDEEKKMREMKPRLYTYNIVRIIRFVGFQKEINFRQYFTLTIFPKMEWFVFAIKTNRKYISGKE